MPKQIEVPDGSLVEFPDEMSDDDILGVLKSNFPTQTTTSLLPPPSEFPSEPAQKFPRWPASDREKFVQEDVPLSGRLAAPLAAGLEMGLSTPERMLRSGLDATGFYNAFDKITGADSVEQNRAWQEWFKSRDEQLRRESSALGMGGTAGQLIEGTTKAVTELPLQLMSGAGAATPARAILGSSIFAGSQGGLMEHERARLAGEGRAAAAIQGLTSGGITALTTRAFGATGIESVFRKEGVQGIKNRLLQIGKDAGLEGIEEGVDQVQQDLLERVNRNPGKPISESLGESLMAVGIGSLVGGGASTAGQAREGVQNVIGDAAFDKEMREASERIANQQALEATFPELRAAEEQFNQRTPDAIQQQSAQVLSGVSQPEVSQEVEQPMPAEESRETAAETRVEPLSAEAISKLTPAEYMAYQQDRNQFEEQTNLAKTESSETLQRFADESRVQGDEILKSIQAVATDPKLNDEQKLQRRMELVDEYSAVAGRNQFFNETLKKKEVLSSETQAAPVPMAQGMGGASAGSAEFNTGTGLANAVGAQERIGFGLPEAYPTVSQKMLPVWNQSGQVIAQDPKAGEKLAAELKINPERGMTDLDSAILLRHKVALENAQNQAAEDSITAGTQEAKQEAMDRFDNISNQLLDLLDAAKFRGSQWGREGRWRQALAFEDYSLETMRRTKRMKADRELTPEEEAETKREHADIVAKQKTAEEARAKDEQTARETQVKEEVADVVKTARTRTSKQKASGVVRDLAAEQVEIVNYLKEHFIEDGDLSDARGSIRKLMELLVEHEGITERLPLETRVHEILSSVDPTLTREGTLDLMSGYGKSKLPSQEPAKKIVRDISQQIISVRKLLDYFKGKRPSLTGILRDAPSDIQRAWLRMVNEAKKNFKLDVPVDNARSIKSATDAINTRLKNRISDLRQEIATRHKIIRERSPSPYNAETLRLRQELEVLKAQHAEIFGSGLTPAQQLARLERSAELQIEELERQIRTGEIFPKSKQALGLTSDKLDAAKAKIEELKLQRQFAREALQPRPEPEVAANEARVTALDKQIAAIEKQLADDAVFSKAKKPRTPSEDARVLEREKKLADLKQQRQFARERNQSQMEPHERFLLNYLLRIRQREAAYKERLATGAFEKTPKPKRDLSPDVLKALAAVDQAKSDFQRGLHEYELSRRSRLQKIWDGIKSARNAFVNIVSSYDFSAPRQAFFALLANTSRVVTNPVQGSKLLAVPFQNMFKAWSGEQRSQMIDQWRKNRPNALSGADKTAGIQYTDLHSTTFSKTEENARSVLDDWAKLPIRTGNAAKTAVTFLPKVGSKGVRMSNRAFVTYLNTTRALLFDELLRANFQDQAPTDAQLRVLGNIVNLSTGRGSLSPKTAEVASNLLWAPSLLASRAQVLSGQPFWGKAGREGGLKSQGIVAKEYARWITSAALLLAVVRMFDDKDEDEPTSSDFGKVVRGKTRIDPWGGNQQLAVLMARIAQGQTTSITGDTRDISGRQTGEAVWNFFKNKTRPDIVAAVNATIAFIDRNKKKKDVRVTPEEAIKGAVPVPLAVREIIEVMRDRGMTEGAIIEALGLFGAGVSVYEGREVQK